MYIHVWTYCYFATCCGSLVGSTQFGKCHGGILDKAASSGDILKSGKFSYSKIKKKKRNNGNQVKDFFDESKFFYVEYSIKKRTAGGILKQLAKLSVFANFLSLISQLIFVLRTCLRA